MVDLSHVSDETMQAALRISQAPVICSHSSARALCRHPRNVPDDLLQQVAANGGVVMAVFLPAYLTEEDCLGRRGRRPGRGAFDGTAWGRQVASWPATWPNGAKPIPFRARQRHCRTWPTTLTTSGKWPALSTSGSAPITKAFALHPRRAWRTFRVYTRAAGRVAKARLQRKRPQKSGRRKHPLRVSARDREHRHPSATIPTLSNFP